MSYVPAPLPKVASELGPYTRGELERVAAEFSKPTLTLPTAYAAPTKPRDGMLVLADGVLFNPGAGPGVYCYYGASWHLLG